MPSLPANIVIAVAYVFFAEIGFSMAFATRQVTAVWPPAGIAVAALLLGGYRLWPGIWLGAFLSNAISHEPLLTAAGIAAGNTLGPLLGTYLLRRFTAFDAALERLRDVIGLVVLGSALAMVVTATNGVLNLVASGIVSWSKFGSVWLLWWTGDAMGVLLVAPLILTWATAGRRIDRSEGGALEAVFLGIGLLFTAWLSFMSRFPLAYPVYPFVIWAAIRYRQRGTTLAIAAISAIAVWGTAHGQGPFSYGSLDQRLTYLVTFVGVLAVTGLVLCALIAERRLADADLRETQETLRGREAQLERVAQTLRGAFLPERLPQRPNLRIDALYMTAGHEALIGGDWYDAFELADGRLVISIGDVIGHGLDAAVTAGRIRQAILAAALDASDPATILEKVNRMLQLQTETVATALVAMIDRDLTTMRYVNAGHPPPMTAGPAMQAQSLPSGGIPLGVAATLGAKTQTLTLQPGAVVLFYTDGLTEFKRRIEDTERVLLGALARLVGDDGNQRPTVTLQRAVMGSDEPADDVVLLVLQLLPDAAGARASDELRQQWSFHSSDAYSAHASRHEMIRFMRTFTASPDELFRAELILGELLANTVEHAPGRVDVEIDWTGANPTVTVLDTGPGLSRLTTDLPADDFAEHGRGLFIIAALAQHVQVESAPGQGTRLRIMLPVSREAEPA